MKIKNVILNKIDTEIVLEPDLEIEQSEGETFTAILEMNAEVSKIEDISEKETDFPLETKEKSEGSGATGTTIELFTKLLISTTDPQMNLETSTISSVTLGDILSGNIDTTIAENIEIKPIDTEQVETE